MPDVGHGSGSPVNSALPLHQFLIDEVATQRCEVWVSARDGSIDLGFRVAPPSLKVVDKPAQDGQTLCALRRNADEAIAGANEVLA